MDRGHIYSSNYSGWYCISDETFLTETQIKSDIDGRKFSIESGHPVEWSEETNYMFRLSQFRDDIVYWIKQG
jgi:methionyl-tRNA synthetase